MLLSFSSKKSQTPGVRADAHGLSGAIQNWWLGKTVQQRRLRHIETLMLGAQRSVALVECDGCNYLVGLGSGGVQTIVAAASMRERSEASR